MYINRYGTADRCAHASEGNIGDDGKPGCPIEWPDGKCGYGCHGCVNSDSFDVDVHVAIMALARHCWACNDMPGGKRLSQADLLQHARLCLLESDAQIGGTHELADFANEALIAGLQPR